MTKAEFIAAIAEKAEITKVKAHAFTDAFLATVTDLLPQEDKISFPKFGKFSVKKRAARKGKNPRTGGV